MSANKDGLTVSSDRALMEEAMAGFMIESMSSEAFDESRFDRQWLVEGLLVKGQAGVIGGPKKALKSSLVVDLAISLGSATPVLGEFPVPARRRTAVFSGESGAATLQEAACRVCRARHVHLSDCLVEWAFRLPRLSDDGEREALGEFLRTKKIKVVFIDPLYACLLGGDRAVSPSNVYEVGPLLWDAARTCLDAGATPVFVHHATKSGAKRTAGTEEGLDLDDLAFSGVAEFARQWILVRRQEPYVPGTGCHRLQGQRA
jgi:replicative DNA helicase